MTTQKQIKVKKTKDLHSGLAITEENTIDGQKENKEVKPEITGERKQAISFSSLCTSSIVGSAIAIDCLYDSKMDVNTLGDNLSEKIGKVIDGDLRGIESLLVTQAHTLDAIFKNMLIRAANSELVAHLQTYSDIALKAQTQCRQTLTVLAELKNPKRTTFVKQQNNAINQQVNNEITTSSLEKTKNKTTHSNELLIEAMTHEALEFGRSKEASKINSQVEAVAAIDRSKND